MLPAISVESLSKKYHLGLREKKHQTFREAMMETIASPLKRFRELSGNGHADSEFWALRDVSFEVKEGEVLGIIGRNGAGKSTLLKILSRITEPTSGRAVIRGRVASLLEVGTGFHNELSGRENVYLNGAILGMTKSEIDRKFDEIVDFSGVEKFLDTAIKHYSSGMKVRLAFAVAAHLDPEILIIDEVLAVGDQEFQNKCMGKMQDVAVGGRTVLFVSHNMPAVEGLCDRCILLAKGALRSDGQPESVIGEYMAESCQVTYDVDLTHHAGRTPGATALIRRLRFIDDRDHVLSCIALGQPLTMEVQLESPHSIPGVVVAVHISNMFGQRVVTYHTGYQHRTTLDLNGPVTLFCSIPECRLMPGTYSVTVALASGTSDFDRIESATQIVVEPRDIYRTGRIPLPKDGVFVPRAEWTIAGVGKGRLANNYR